MTFRLLTLSSIAASALIGLAAPATAGGCTASSCYRAPVSNCGSGSCYKLVTTPPVYDTVSESYVVRPERTFSKVIPAQYETVTEKVVLRPQRRIARQDVWFSVAVIMISLTILPGLIWGALAAAVGGLSGAAISALHARRSFRKLALPTPDEPSSP